MNKSNHLVKTQRLLINCVRAILIMRKRKTPRPLASSNASNRELDPKEAQNIVWSLFQRHWYAAKITKFEDITRQLQNKLQKIVKKNPDDFAIVTFYSDNTISAIPKSKIEALGTTTVDKARSKRDEKRYEAALTELEELTCLQTTTSPSGKYRSEETNVMSGAGPEVPKPSLAAELVKLFSTQWKPTDCHNILHLIPS